MTAPVLVPYSPAYSMPFFLFTALLFRRSCTNQARYDNSLLYTFKLSCVSLSWSPLALLTRSIPVTVLFILFRSYAELVKLFSYWLASPDARLAVQSLRFELALSAEQFHAAWQLIGSLKDVRHVGLVFIGPIRKVDLSLLPKLNSLM